MSAQTRQSRSGTVSSARNSLAVITIGTVRTCDLLEARQSYLLEKAEVLSSSKMLVHGKTKTRHGSPACTRACMLPLSIPFRKSNAFSDRFGTRYRNWIGQLIFLSARPAEGQDNPCAESASYNSAHELYARPPDARGFCDVFSTRSCLNFSCIALCDADFESCSL